MTYAARVVADSVSPDGARLTTIEATFPRIVLAEANTHRDKTRNSASSRAIPVKKRIQMVQETPYVPEQFGSNRPGMQSGDPLAGEAAETARLSWLRARDAAVLEARVLAELGVHKEYANRLLEPFLWHTAVFTATDWDNFWNLRCHPDASEPIRIVAELMREAYRVSDPFPLNYGDWHLPYVEPDEAFDFEVRGLSKADLVAVSAGRAARLSYLTHEGKKDPTADVALYHRLRSSGHMSPLEHPARPMTSKEREVFRMHEWTFSDGSKRWGRDFGTVSFKHTGGSRLEWPEGQEPGTPDAPEVTVVQTRVTHYLGNFDGWFQHRKEIPGEAVFGQFPGVPPGGIFLRHSPAATT